MGTHPREVNGGCSAISGSVKAPPWHHDIRRPRQTRRHPPAIERRERFERARRNSLRAAGDGPTIMYGWHTVTAALNNPARRLRKLLATENAARRLAEEGITPRACAGTGAAFGDRRAAYA